MYIKSTGSGTPLLKSESWFLPLKSCVIWVKLLKLLHMRSETRTAPNLNGNMREN